MAQEILKGKLKITATLHLQTGLHIGGSSEFAPIGAVDSSVIRDPYSKQPIIPGSSLKGKIRSLLRRNEGTVDSKNESNCLKRLFGAAGDEVLPSRLQFFDIKMTYNSVEELEHLDMDTYLGEIKFENTINAITGAANPRQIERVPAGARFAFQLVYNITDETQIKEDMEKLSEGIQLLQWDYLGGSGSRGYGRVAFTNWHVDSFCNTGTKETELATAVQQQLERSVGV